MKPWQWLSTHSPGVPAPLLALVEAMAVRHLEMYGDGFAPLPPVPLPATPEEQAALLRATPLLRLQCGNHRIEELLRAYE
ncbi:hypothetical protein [Streptomyces sp. NPDC054865]